MLAYAFYGNVALAGVLALGLGAGTAWWLHEADAPPRDAAALARALVEMARIVGDPALRTQWSAAARAAVMPFEQEAVLGRFTRMLEELAGARQGT